MSKHISINVRYLLWRKDIPKSGWLSWLTKATTTSDQQPMIDPQTIRTLVTGAIEDEHISPKVLQTLGGAFDLGDDTDNLRYVSLMLDGCNVLEENLRYLFDSLGHGGKKSVAGELRVDPTTVSRWLNGSSEPQTSTLLELVSWFGLPPGTDLTEEPIFLSVEPVSMTERRNWLHARLDAMSTEELRELYPALRRILEER